jgi:ligand-binding sensor domain-containing protein/signal transduction histidine kinase
MNAATVMNTGLRLMVTTLLVAAAQSARCAAAAPEPDPGFTLQSWETADGLPPAAITALARTPDGYLWLGTGAGLVRFDGVRFVTLTTNTTPGLADHRITSLLVDGNGVLWIGSLAGTLARCQGGAFSEVARPPALRGIAINSIQPAQRGGLWLGTRGRGLVRWVDGACDFSVPTNGLRQADVSTVVREEPGRLWAVSTARLLLLEQGRWRYAPDGPGATTPTFAVAPGADGAAVIATASENPLRNRGGRVFRLAGEPAFAELAPYPWSQDADRSSPRSVLEDRTGRVWVGTAGAGVFCWQPGGGWARLPEDEVLADTTVRVMMEDADGSIWFGGSRGTLHRVRERLVTALPLAANGESVRVNSVSLAPDGAAWVGTEDSGVFRCAHGATEQLTNGLGNLHVRSVLADRQTNLWAGTLAGLYRWQLGAFSEQPLPVAAPVVSALFEDRAGNLWAGTSKGLVRRSPDGVAALFAGPEGLDHFFIRGLAEDLQGRLWVAVGDRGLYRQAGGRFELIGSDRWTAGPQVRSLYADADGALWITTSGLGLFRFWNGEFGHWGVAKDLPEGSLLGVTEDARGNLWLGSENGIFGCPKAALLAEPADRRWPLLFWHLSLADGLESRSCSGAGQPIVAHSADGRLWFPNRRAVAVFDPVQASETGQFLPPRTEEIVADGIRCQPDAEGSVTVRSGARRVEFHYTCPDLRWPERLRFRYQLAGSDADWSDAGAQRVAYYGRLAPGEYQFRVMAGGASGEWREAEAGLRFIVVPLWWERASVRVASLALGALTLGGAAWLTARARGRRKLARLQLQQARESERIRIARDLHDDLGASLTHVVLQSEMLASRAAAGEEAPRRARTIAEAAAEAVKSLDEIVWAVSPRHDTLDSLLQYLSQFAGELFEDSEVSLTLELPPEPPAIPLSAETRHNVFLAVKEALNNTLKHSQARHVRLRVVVREAAMEIEVADDGVGGVDPTSVAGRRRDGLPNMQQRLTALGGSLRIESPPKQGTRVTMVVPLQQPAANA